MAASANDKMRKVKGFFSTTLSSQKNSGAASMSLSDATGVPTTTGLIFTVGRVDSQGTSTPSTRAIYKGTLSGTTVSNLALVEGTDQTHAAGTVVEMTWTETHVNDLVDALTAEHSQLDGTHTDITADSITVNASGNIGVPNASAIRDENNNELLKFSQTTSAVNEVTVKNAATGNKPELQATGSDTNIGLKFTPKGTGKPEGFANFYVGTIAGATMGTTGNKAITGVGFTPKLVTFHYLGSTGATTASFGGHGSMTATSQFTQCFGGNTSSAVRWSATTRCLSAFTALSDSNPELQASYVSMDADGFTINVDVAVDIGGNGYGFVAYG